MGTSTGRVREPVAGCPGDQIIARSGDIPVTLVIHVFLNSAHKHIKVTLKGSELDLGLLQYTAAGTR